MVVEKVKLAEPVHRNRNGKLKKHCRKNIASLGKINVLLKIGKIFLLQKFERVLFLGIIRELKPLIQIEANINCSNFKYRDREIFVIQNF